MPHTQPPLDPIDELLSFPDVPTHWTLEEECMITATDYRKRSRGVVVVDDEWKPSSTEGYYSFIRKYLSALSGPVIAAKVSDHEERITKNEREIGELRAIVQSLSDDRTPPTAPDKGPYDQWIESPESEPFDGKHVAWTPEAGVIASSFDPSEVFAAIRNDPRKGSAVIGFVSRAEH
jgi:hypothetical protein